MYRTGPHSSCRFVRRLPHGGPSANLTPSRRRLLTRRLASPNGPSPPPAHDSDRPRARMCHDRRARRRSRWSGSTPARSSPPRPRSRRPRERANLDRRRDGADDRRRTLWRRRSELRRGNWRRRTAGRRLVRGRARRRRGPARRARPTSRRPAGHRARTGTRRQWGYQLAIDYQGTVAVLEQTGATAPTTTTTTTTTSRHQSHPRSCLCCRSTDTITITAETIRGSGLRTSSTSQRRDGWRSDPTCRELARLGQKESQDRPRMRPLVGTPVPAVTSTCSTGSTWLHEIPRI